MKNKKEFELWDKDRIRKKKKIKRNQHEISHDWFSDTLISSGAFYR